VESKEPFIFSYKDFLNGIENTMDNDIKNYEVEILADEGL